MSANERCRYPPKGGVRLWSRSTILLIIEGGEGSYSEVTSYVGVGGGGGDNSPRIPT